MDIVARATKNDVAVATKNLTKAIVTFGMLANAKDAREVALNVSPDFFEDTKGFMVVPVSSVLGNYVMSATDGAAETLVQGTN